MPETRIFNRKLSLRISNHPNKLRKSQVEMEFRHRARQKTEVGQAREMNWQCLHSCFDPFEAEMNLRKDTMIRDWKDGVSNRIESTKHRESQVEMEFPLQARQMKGAIQDRERIGGDGNSEKRSNSCTLGLKISLLFTELILNWPGSQEKKMRFKSKSLHASSRTRFVLLLNPSSLFTKPLFLRFQLKIMQHNSQNHQKECRRASWGGFQKRETSRNVISLEEMKLLQPYEKHKGKYRTVLTKSHIFRIMNFVDSIVSKFSERSKL